VRKIGSRDATTEATSSQYLSESSGKKRKQHYKEKSTLEKKKAMEIDKKLEANECLFSK